MSKNKSYKIGNVYNKLKIIEFSHRDSKSLIFVKCLCECGNHKIMNLSNIKRGMSKTCGCSKSIMNKKRENYHGLTNTPEYQSWRNLKSRCCNKSISNYKNYGGRGITVCDRWLANFTNFLEDMGKKPSPVHQIDRINNNGNYEPSNCRWVTPKVNSNNRSNSYTWYVLGQRYKTASEAGKLLGVSRATIGNWCIGWCGKDGQHHQPRNRCYRHAIYESEVQ